MKKNNDLLKLVYRVLKGDEEAIQAILLKKKRLIYSYIRRYLSKEYYSHVDDVFQEVCANFLKAIRDNKIKEPHKIGSYIIGLTIRTTKSYYKREIRKPKKIIDKLTELISSQQQKLIINMKNDIIKEELLAKLESSLNFLNKEEREIIIMRFFEEMTFKEIGKIFNISTSTAKRRFDRAMENLHDIIFKANN